MHFDLTDMNIISSLNLKHLYNLLEDLDQCNKNYALSLVYVLFPSFKTIAGRRTKKGIRIDKDVGPI